jgi:hypothetical protein
MRNQPNFVDTNARDGTKFERVPKRIYQALFSDVNLRKTFIGGQAESSMIPTSINWFAV